MTGLLLVALLFLATFGVTAWSVKTRPRWPGNGLLVMAVGELLWVWLLVAAHGGGYPVSMWVTWGICHVLVAGVGYLTARWMGDTLPGADGRGWFHLSTVIAAALTFSVGLAWVVTVVEARSRWGAGVDDTLIVLTVLGAVGIVAWAAALVALLWFLRDVRRGRHRKPSEPRSVDAVVVLGAGLVGEEVSDLLAARCDRGAAAWREVEKARGAGGARQVPLIVSGGQGPDEACPEAYAMRRYYARRGFPRDVVVAEAYANDTTENLHFSLEILAERKVYDPRILVCTSDFHVMRTKRIVGMLQQSRGEDDLPFEAEVLGAPTPKAVIPAAYLREFVALSIHRIFGRA
ncbi:MAG TPA: YdcF family protein [Candidatus Corynebacterium avicola]|uniref:YdcF family protein n=1 Tax=Candidatus Corynebacterium avicola TaxID=2838527 RepID=A0A9D1RRZ9_9CORY|nr:YdcF family protein [Candidatus Corynebacterium avicola]